MITMKKWMIVMKIWPQMTHFYLFFEDPLYNSDSISVDETKNLATLNIAKNQESNGRQPEKSLKSIKKKAPIFSKD